VFIRLIRDDKSPDFDIGISDYRDRESCQEIPSAMPENCNVRPKLGLQFSRSGLLSSD